MMVIFNKGKLKNGLRVICEERESDVSTIMFAVPFGECMKKRREGVLPTL